MIVKPGKLALFKAYEVICKSCNAETMLAEENITREKAKRELLRKGWKKIKHGGWYCPECK